LSLHWLPRFTILHTPLTRRTAQKYLSNQSEFYQTYLVYVTTMACFIPRSPMLLLLIWQFALIVCKVGIELVVIRYDATQYFFPLTSSATVLRNAIVMSRFRNLLPAPYLLSARIVSGRKVLLSVSGSFTAVSMAVLGLYCQLNDPKQAGESSFAHRSGSFLGVVVLALRQAVFLRFLLRYFTDD